VSNDVVSLTGEGNPYVRFTSFNYGEFPKISYHLLRPERAAVMADYYREHWNENAVFDPLIAIHNAVMDLAQATFDVPPTMDRFAFDSWMRVSFGCAVGASALFATYEARSSQLRQTPSQRLAGFIAANAVDPFTGWEGVPLPSNDLFRLIDPVSGSAGVGSRLQDQIKWLRNYSKVPPDLSDIPWIAKGNNFQSILTKLQLQLYFRQDVIRVLGYAFPKKTYTRFQCILHDLTIKTLSNQQKTQ
jgi:hypothetical protein